MRSAGGCRSTRRSILVGYVPIMKKFFEKKKLDYKFAKAGAGHSLAGTSASSSRAPPQQQAPDRERQHPGQASQLAGTAALSRLDHQSSSGASKSKLKHTTGT